MARAQTRLSLNAFPFGALSRPLSKTERTRVRGHVTKLLAWQRTLIRWPSARAAGFPAAVPFVSIYAGGRLLGCFGTPEGSAAERLSRAFLLALHDGRFASPAGQRDALAIEVAYPRSPVRLNRLELESALEPGHHAIGFAKSGAPPVLLLPSVARDGGLEVQANLELVARKAGVTPDALAEGALFVCEMETLVVRARPHVASKLDSRELAARWLARRIDGAGSIEFGCDPRTGQRALRGEFHHGRSAIVIRALDEHGTEPALVRRAKRCLLAEIRAGLRGTAPPGWPRSVPEVAGTLALALMAGVDVRRALAALAKHRHLARVPWHAAQVVLALGKDAPPALWRACVADLAATPWAPWTCMAARALGDDPTLARTTRALLASVRSTEPYRGGVGKTSTPELALTAVVVEALAGDESRAALGAIRDAQAFLRRWQHVDPIPAAYAPEVARGGFPLAPIAPLQRADVTAHALRALSVPA